MKLPANSPAVVCEEAVYSVYGGIPSLPVFVSAKDIDRCACPVHPRFINETREEANDVPPAVPCVQRLVALPEHVLDRALAHGGTRITKNFFTVDLCNVVERRFSRPNVQGERAGLLVCPFNITSGIEPFNPGDTLVEDTLMAIGGICSLSQLISPG